MGLIISLFASYRANDPVFWELVTCICRLGKNKTKQVVAKPPSLGVIDKTPQRPSLVIPKSEYELVTKLPNGVTIRMKRGKFYYFKPSDSNLGELNFDKLDSPYIQRAGFSVVVDGDEFIVFPEEKGAIDLMECLLDGRLLPIDSISQFSQACRHMREKGIFNFDIKPENILLLKNGNILFIDFGGSDVMKTGQVLKREHTFTGMYNAPEVVPEKWGKPINIGAAQVMNQMLVLFTMVFKKTLGPMSEEFKNTLGPISNDNNANHYWMWKDYSSNPKTQIPLDLNTLIDEKQTKYTGPIPSDIIGRFCSLFKKVFVYNPNDRPTGFEVGDELDDITECLRENYPEITKY
jgi:serine/threonine protein kinase